MVIKTLFLENYKGYKRVFLPLVDVNFFVGENSSGKTAVLNLLYLIHQPDFWLSGNLNSNEVELGYFEEIINKFSNDLESFSIGLEVLEQPNETLSYFRFLSVRLNRLKNKLLANYLRNRGNDLATVRNSAFCVAILSNNSFICKYNIFFRKYELSVAIL